MAPTQAAVSMTLGEEGPGAYFKAGKEEGNVGHRSSPKASRRYIAATSAKNNKLARLVYRMLRNGMKYVAREPKSAAQQHGPHDFSAMSTTALILITVTLDRCRSAGRSASTTSRQTRRGMVAAT